MTDTQPFRPPVGLPDRLPGEGDRARAVRLHDAIRHAPTTRRGYLPEHRELLAADEADATDPANLADVRYSQLDTVWAALEVAAVDRQKSVDWNPARAVAIMKAHAADVEAWLSRLPDIPTYRARRDEALANRPKGPEADIDRPEAWWRRYPQHLHAGPQGRSGHARPTPDGSEPVDETAHRNIIEWGLLHAATMLWAALHPSAVELTPLARTVATVLDDYWRETGGQFLVAPDPRRFRVRIGQYLDMHAQAVGADVPNPTGVQVLNTRAHLAGWTAPRGRFS